MNRWGVRIVGLLFIVILLVMLFRLQSRLAEMQRARGAQTATTPAPP
jgi:hypothetical protein